MVRGCMWCATETPQLRSVANLNATPLAHRRRHAEKKSANFWRCRVSFIRSPSPLVHLPTSDQLLAYVDGDTNAPISAHLARCGECHRITVVYALTQRQLREALYRFDCPSAHTLGEYALDLLIDPQRHQIAQHALECSECADELRTARTFFASDTPLAAPRGWRRVIARLLTSDGHPALVPVRGAARETSFEYHAGAVHIVLGTLPARERGSVDLDGIVMHDTAATDAVAERDVALLVANLRVYATRTDDLGNFAFDSIADGTYQLEVHLPDEVVVIENLRVGGPRPT